MSLPIRSGRVHASVFAALSSVALGISLPSVAAAQEPCAPFVRLVDGQFYEGYTPYAMEGPNISMAVAALYNGNNDPSWDYFLAPVDVYRPDGKSVCTTASQTSCCDSRDSCHDDLQYDVDGLVSMGANSVRLIVPYMQWKTNTNYHTPYLPCTTAYSGQISTPPCEMDLMDPDVRQRALELIEEQIDWLGDAGIRTILLTGRPDDGDVRGQAEYNRWLEDLSARLVNNPYLIAYDPMNEPMYGYDAGKAGYTTCPNGQGTNLLNCKSIAHDATRIWHDHLTLNDPNHLVTVGLGGVGSVFMWDPAVIWDHFTSYHIYSYPFPLWDDPGPGAPAGGPPYASGPPVSGKHGVENDIYYGALNECGLPCPFVGDFDGANCYVTAGPAGTVGSLGTGTFQYSHMPAGPPCPMGTNNGTTCDVATFGQGRDTPFILDQPIYYVDPNPNGTCPPGTVSDSAHCIAFYGPPGAHPFIWAPPGGTPGFYYSYLSPTDHCHPPATDDTANCYLGPVPGNNPFILERPLYYVTAQTCGTKKPVHFGETGFSVYPYPGGSPSYWTPPPPNVPEVSTLKTQCDDWDGGPPLDFVQIGSHVYEAEAATITYPAGTPNPIHTCAACSGGKAVLLFPGVQLDFHLPKPVSGCNPLRIGYHSLQQRRLWLTIPGRGPRRFVVPPLSGWGQMTLANTTLPAGTNLFTITNPYDSANGDAVQQAQFLTGDGGSWAGIYPFGQACGFQGLHYWWYGTTATWGGCGDSAVNAPWYEVSTTNPPSGTQRQIELRLSSAAETLRDQVNMLAPVLPKCEEPTDFHTAMSRELGPFPAYTYEGTIVSHTTHQPLANVPVRLVPLDCGDWRTAISTHTDWRGKYLIRSDYPATYVETSHFGYVTNGRWVGPSTTGYNAVPTIELEPMTGLPNLPAPVPPVMACRGPGGWVPQ